MLSFQEQVPMRRPDHPHCERLVEDGFYQQTYNQPPPHYPAYQVNHQHHHQPQQRQAKENEAEVAVGAGVEGFGPPTTMTTTMMKRESRKLTFICPETLAPIDHYRSDQSSSSAKSTTSEDGGGGGGGAAKTIAAKKTESAASKSANGAGLPIGSKLHRWMGSIPRQASTDRSRTLDGHQQQQRQRREHRPLGLYYHGASSIWSGASSQDERRTHLQHPSAWATTASTDLDHHPHHPHRHRHHHDPLEMLSTQQRQPQIGGGSSSSSGLSCVPNGVEDLAFDMSFMEPSSSSTTTIITKTKADMYEDDDEDDDEFPDDDNNEAEADGHRQGVPKSSRLWTWIGDGHS